MKRERTTATVRPENVLKSCIKQSTVVDEQGSSVLVRSDFFSSWFREHGSAYYFLFKKNLKVTNIQFAELLALLRCHVRTTTKEDTPPFLHFLSTKEFNAEVEQLVNSMFADASQPSEVPAIPRRVAALYGNLFRTTVVVDAFFGSCAVFLPPGLTLDIRLVCQESGYVHSCGELLFVRNVEKAKKEDLEKQLTRHIERRYQTSALPFFAVYSDEDFTKFDRDTANELRDGLDDVKIHLGKFFMGPDSLVTVLGSLRETFKDRLVIPFPGDFRDRHIVMRQQKPVDSNHTIWLLVERSVDPLVPHQGEKRYYICYDQVYKNESPYQIFDENKPAWIAPVTIPHTLMASMLNISRPKWSAKGQTVVCDPFVGTGTTYLETLKFPGAVSRCSDLDPLVGRLVADNLEVFGMNSADLEHVTNWLNALMAEATRATLEPPRIDGAPHVKKAHSVVLKAYRWAIKMCEAYDKPGVRNWSGNQREKFAQSLEAGSDLKSRLLFYLAVRAHLRHLPALQMAAEDWTTAYKKELEEICREFDALRRLRKREETGAQPTESPGNPFREIKGSYSAVTTVPGSFINEVRSTNPTRPVVLNALHLRPDTADVIVADPPYGFNTDEKMADLASLYEGMMKVFARALRTNGQIVLCLLDKSHTGRKRPFFTHRKLVSRQLLAAATEAGFQSVDSSPQLPEPHHVFAGPYFWESGRALRRAIVHLQLAALQKSHP